MVGYNVDNVSADISGVIDHCLMHFDPNHRYSECDARIYLVTGVVLALFILAPISFPVVLAPLLPEKLQESIFNMTFPAEGVNPTPPKSVVDEPKLLLLNILHFVIVIVPPTIAIPAPTLYGPPEVETVLLSILDVRKFIFPPWQYTPAPPPKPPVLFINEELNTFTLLVV